MNGTMAADRNGLACRECLNLRPKRITFEAELVATDSIESPKGPASSLPPRACTIVG